MKPQREGVSITCQFCGKVYFLPIPDAALEAWENGEFIQRAWPEGSPSERELLISRTCGTCFDEMFPEEDE